MTCLPPHTPVVVAARRTPIGTAGHGLARVDVAGLLAPVLTAVLADLPEATRPAEVVIGNCLGPGGNPARYAVLAAGLGVDVPAVTVDRQCGSGQEAVHQGATLVRAGLADGDGLVLAGGVESASTAPYRMLRPVNPTGLPVPYERAPFAPAAIGDPEMGAAADDVARRYGVSRQRQDAYAARSHALTLAATRAGAFDAELVPVGGLDHDERPRPIREAVLARLRPAFGAASDGTDGAEAATVTAGNSCGISDGAAVVAIVTESVRARWGVPGLALLDWLTVGVDPRLPGVGPVPAVEWLLARGGLTWADIDALELTEAFAAQVLACTDAWGLDPFAGPLVCGQGGAIALGHPWGASGALLVVRLFARLVRDAAGPASDTAGYGVAACAVGGGQGMALLGRRVGP